ncbi:DUF4269 domain-containing protein [Flavobacterium sp. MFBS3-15]|uniref:DUF4269 domain-containing protein n=1 Tax=Flavobacterium sp. MFBS3-15 TaxID=2989816 RepID=UPI002235E43F|nr:DUF4269 domain-containing protein [Flavobacterium sp. MFBS3-15]MCW4467896.1 DUF4269 domain-containing protein [Flavobacterium sp. MFBS3-15]
MLPFDTIDYLKDGTTVQQNARKVLDENRIMLSLHAYTPILAGTIPLNINVDGSDLDILCCFDDEGEFAASLETSFSEHEGFILHRKKIAGIPTTIANFFVGGFEIEVFGQPIPVKEQNGYRHMIIEHQILEEKNEAFRLEVISLKESGMKTEPAFAKLLGLEGEPYQALLRYKI